MPIDIENAPLTFSRRVAAGKPENIRNPDGYCPFCDTESLTNVIRRDGDRIWLVNKYRTLEHTMQTIVIESARHDGDPSNYGREENRGVFRFALGCWAEMLRSGKYTSVLMYKNYGPMSGGTLLHPHFQVVGLEDKDGYERVPMNCFEGTEVVRDAGRLLTISSHPIMGFVELNVQVPDRTCDSALAAPADVDWLADVTRVAVRYLLSDYHGGRCTSYNLFFYHTQGRVICKVIPRWVGSPYFVGYRISQVDGPETIEHECGELRHRILADLEEE